MAYIIPRDKLQVGDQIHSWTILTIPPRAFGRALCRCRCGREKEVILNCLLNGGTKECRSCASAKCHHKHGETVGRKKTRLYHTWQNMLYRCSPEGVKHYPGYYDAGIRVCDEWRNSFVAFRDWSLANGYRDDLSIDRWPDQRGNYEPSNCRWATTGQQGENRRTTRMTSAFGESKPVQRWAVDHRCLVSVNALRERLAAGWEPEVAITTPPVPDAEKWRFAKRWQQS